MSTRLVLGVVLFLAVLGSHRSGEPGFQDTPGTVSGVVTAADTGRPIPGAEVRLQVFSQGEQRIAKTDRSGRYEFADVQPARYVVRAAAARYLPSSGGRDPREGPAPITVRGGERIELNVALQRYGAISGRVIDHFGDPVPGISVVAMRHTFTDGLRRLVPGGGTLPSRQTDDLGQFRLYLLEPGDYYVVALAGPFTAVPPFNESNDTGGFLPTFYPSAATVRAATPVALRPGEEREGLVVGLLPGRGVRVSGTAVDSMGNPFAKGLMSISPVDAAAAGALLAGRDQAQADGSFVFSNVPPGSYVIQARSLGTAGSFTGEFGWLHVSVGDADLPDLLVQTSPGSTVTGRVTVESEAPGSRVPMGTMPTLVPVDLDTQPVLPTGSAPIRARIGEQVEIGFKQMWGRQRFWILPGPWVLKSVTVGGRDVTDTPIELRGQPVTADIVVTETAATLSGRVLDEHGRPAPECTVIVFATDRALWTPRSRYVHAVTADGTGEFTVAGIVPGRYLAVALALVERGRWTDPEFLAVLSDSATSFPAVERERRTIDLALTRAR